MLFCQAFFPINGNTSRHTSLVSNVDNSCRLSAISLTLTWSMWEIDLMARMLYHSLIAHNSRSQKLTTTVPTASSSSRGHSAWFQGLPLTVSSEGKEQETISLSMLLLGSMLPSMEVGGGAPPSSPSHLSESVPPSAIFWGLRGSQTVGSQH